MLVKVAVILSLVAACLAQDCVLAIPATPLTATGLATPYVQTGCTQTIPTEASFVQGAVFDPSTGHISIYNPLVIDSGTKPGCTPVTPALPQGSTVAIWFGTNGGTLTITDNGNGGLNSGACINGYTDPTTLMFTIFGQFAYCNAPVFFDGVKASLKVTPPPLGIAADGQTCPTTRDFFVVDMDPSDNVVTAYLLLNNNRVCQNTTTNFLANQANIQATLTNGSDERLVVALLQALGGTCAPWQGVDLAETGAFLGQTMAPGLPLNEIEAIFYQQAPVATIPLADPMVLVNAQPNLNKVNAYRAGVGHPHANTNADADSTNFCFFYYTIQPLRLLKNMATFSNIPSPDPNMGTNLFTFMCNRYVQSFGPNGLDCANKLQIPAPGPITVTLDGNGVAIDALVIPPNNGIGGGNTAAFTTPLIKNGASATTAWSTTTIVAVAVGGFVGLLTIVGFIVAFRAHRVRNFCAGIRDGIATKMRD